MQYTDFTALTLILLALTGLITLINWVYIRYYSIKTESTPALEESIKYKTLSFIKTTFYMLFLIVGIRSFIFEPFKIPSGSMLPTLKTGDFVIVNRFAYGLRIPLLGHQIIPINDPQPGDIVVFQFPKTPRIAYIKRLIGVPGDRIRYTNNQLFVNDKLIEDSFFSKIKAPYDPKLGVAPWVTLYEESLGKHQFHIQRHLDYTESEQPDIDHIEYIVPKNQYFVMGDNRDKSYDSRFWGFVPDEYLIGKAAYIWLHWPKSNALPSIKRNRIIP